MIIWIAFLLAAPPSYAELDPFMDEERAARAFEAHMYCLGDAAFERQKDLRMSSIIAGEVVQVCNNKEATLRAALVDVYRRKPALIGKSTPEDAANQYVNGARARVEVGINEFRKQNK